MIVLGINHFTDPAACIVVDKTLVAFVEEERFTRLKGNHNIFPGNSVAFCLREAGISIEDVDKIAVPYNAYYYPFSFMGKMAKEYISLLKRKWNSKTSIRKSSSNIIQLALARTPASMRQTIKEGLLQHGIY